MKILLFVMCSILLSLGGCSTLTGRPENSATPSRIDWEVVRRHTEELTTPREVKGPYKHRGETSVWGELWDLSLQQELAHDGSEGDKVRARDYWNTVIDRAIELEKPVCKWYVLRREYCRSR